MGGLGEAVDGFGCCCCLLEEMGDLGDGKGGQDRISRSIALGERSWSSSKGEELGPIYI